jgi:hypothetical protein
MEPYTAEYCLLDIPPCSVVDSYQSFHCLSSRANNDPFFNPKDGALCSSEMLREYCESIWHHIIKAITTINIRWVRSKQCDNKENHSMILCHYKSLKSYVCINLCLVIFPHNVCHHHLFHHWAWGNLLLASETEFFHCFRGLSEPPFPFA